MLRIQQEEKVECLLTNQLRRRFPFLIIVFFSLVLCILTYKERPNVHCVPFQLVLAILGWKDIDWPWSCDLRTNSYWKYVNQTGFSYIVAHWKSSSAPASLLSWTLRKVYLLYQVWLTFFLLNEKKYRQVNNRGTINRRKKANFLKKLRDKELIKYSTLRIILEVCSPHLNEGVKEGDKDVSCSFLHYRLGEPGNAAGGIGKGASPTKMQL